MKQVALSPAQWDRTVALYQSGEVTIGALGIRFGVTYEAIRLGFRPTCGTRMVCESYAVRFTSCRVNQA